MALLNEVTRLGRSTFFDVLETVLDPAEVAALLAGRRTIHRFDPHRPVSPELLQRAFGVAIQAPNHKRTEPWRFYALGPETRERLINLNADVVRAQRGEAAAEKKRLRWQGIPGFVVVTCRRTDDALREREDYAACACAVQNLMLYLWSAGVGTKWTTGAVTREARLLDLIGADAQNESVVALLHYGHPDETPTSHRRPVSEFVHHLP